VAEQLSENLKRTRNPSGTKNEKINTWWKSTRIRSKDEWLFLTGMLFQLATSIEAIVKFLEGAGGDIRLCLTDQQEVCKQD